MRKKLGYYFSTMVLGWLALPAGAQAPQVPEPVPVPPVPQVQPLPVPIPLGQPQPVESPPSAPALTSNGVFAGMGAADPCCPHGYWSTGGGVYFIQPYFNSNPAFISVTGNG